jgi:hypothetical protein
MKYLIILVHGTFARNAPWAHSDSEFCKTLASELGGEVSYRTFNWSGSNSHKSRVIASHHLRLMLEEYVDQKDTQKIILAHSHGGNIAMYAQRGLGEKAHEYSLVTMATPYLNAEKRDYSPYLSVNLFLFPLLLSLSIVLAISLFFYFYVRQFAELAGVVTAIGCAYYCSRLYRWTNKIEKRINDKVEYVLAEIAFLKAPRYNKILAIIDSRDEIKIWFRLWSYVWNLITSVQTIVFNYVLATVLLFTLINLFRLIADLFFNSDIYKPLTEVILLHLFMFFITFLFAIGTCLTITLFTALAFYLLKSNVIMLGWETWIHQVFIRIQPSTQPVGYNKMTFIQYRGTVRTRGLKHSIYNNTGVVQEISNWIHQEVQAYQRPATPLVENYLEIVEDPEKVKQMALLFIAAVAEFELHSLLTRLDLKTVKQTTAYITQTKAENAAEIKNIFSSSAMLLLDQVIALVCSLDDRRAGERLCGKLLNLNYTDSQTYVANIIKKAGIDMVKEKQRENDRRKSDLYRLPKRITATLLLLLCAYFAYQVLLSTGTSSWQVKLFYVFILTSYIFKTIFSLIVTIRFGKHWVWRIFKIGKKTFSIEYVFIRLTWMECLAYGLADGFIPLGVYFENVLYFAIPGFFIASLHSD